MTPSRVAIFLKKMVLCLSFAMLGLSMSSPAFSQSERFAGGTLSWTVNGNSQTYNRFTLNHVVYTDFVFTYQGTAYRMPGSAAYVTCNSTYQGECSGYPKIESAFFWLPTASEYVLFDPPVKSPELQQAKSTKKPAPKQDAELGSVDSSGTLDVPEKGR